jgi:predicted metal-dependent hydrolase
MGIVLDSGNLNFNTELLAFSEEVADYVIVHELLHSFVPNHGKLWKSLMRLTWEVMRPR